MDLQLPDTTWDQADPRQAESAKQEFAGTLLAQLIQETWHKSGGTVPFVFFLFPFLLLFFVFVACCYALFYWLSAFSPAHVTTFLVGGSSHVMVEVLLYLFSCLPSLAFLLFVSALGGLLS